MDAFSHSSNPIKDVEKVQSWRTKIKPLYKLWSLANYFLCKEGYSLILQLCFKNPFTYRWKSIFSGYMTPTMMATSTSLSSWSSFMYCQVSGVLNVRMWLVWVEGFSFMCWCTLFSSWNKGKVQDMISRTGWYFMYWAYIFIKILGKIANNNSSLS